jgi:hypothetical protein
MAPESAQRLRAFLSAALTAWSALGAGHPGAAEG